MTAAEALELFKETQNKEVKKEYDKFIEDMKNQIKWGTNVLENYSVSRQLCTVIILLGYKVEIDSKTKSKGFPVQSTIWFPIPKKNIFDYNEFIKSLNTKEDNLDGVSIAESVIKQMRSEQKAEE